MIETFSFLADSMQNQMHGNRQSKKQSAHVRVHECLLSLLLLLQEDLFAACAVLNFR